ncbi:hypothetical protein FB567DRAFT_581779 [Paraphoma chrysanthemicola]|uniref:Uncharacterized protein n=1 Tax=Paraphoma chrysanthemicola TaxID=798071 RepID=A0A8K0QSY3_9PLEO|nr:hypothetical protein FB567DRAFT_284620 [Paraphoma chrysanthemicola]KAH7082440.1 hypothetical protein FB567DRAFT_581779 [Paraphoma chrysanthemicola]
MFSYSYIVPTGPSGYYNYSNQQSSTPPAVPSTPSYTPPITATGAAQSYYGTSQHPQPVQGNPTDSLAQLVPARTELHEPRSNPRLTQLYADHDRLVTGLPVPDHETRYISTLSDFNKWMDQVYHPKMRNLTHIRTELESFLQRIYIFAEESCRLGTAAYTFLTENLEIGDVFAILAATETRLEEIFQALLAMDELKIDIESDTNAADCYISKKTKYAQQWESYKDTTKTTAHVNFIHARTARKKAHCEKVTHFVTTADAIDTPPYEAIMRAIAAIPAIRSEHDVEVLGRAVQILICAKNQGTYIDGIRYQAQSDVMQLEESLVPLQDAHPSQHAALLARQDQITVEMGQKAAAQKQAVENHCIEYGAKPVFKLIEAYRGVTGAQSVPVGGYCAPVAQNAYQAAASPAPPAYTPAPAGAQQEGPKFQMPLSWYSNMLTQSHVTNMQVMNNVGGGSTNFHLANSSGGIIW